MDPNDYQKLAERTESGQFDSLQNRLIHAVLGIQSEGGELADNVKKWKYYFQNLDVENLKEELGDCLWYIALACNACGFSLSDVMEGNIRKLQKRYPQKFDTDLAKEENRDRKAEMKALGDSAVNKGDEEENAKAAE